MRLTRETLRLVLVSGFCFLMAGCGSTSGSSSADTSGSITEAATAATGGAISSTAGDQVGASFHDHFASCPTIVGGGSECSVTGDTFTLSFPAGGCTYNSIGAIWLGSTELTVTPGASGDTPACGTFPVLNGSHVDALTRSYGGTLNASPTSRTNAPGTETVVLDTSAPSGTTFSSAKTSSPTSGTIGWQYAITTTGGYTRTFVSSTNHDLSMNIRLVDYSGSSPSGTVGYDHTLSTTAANGTNTPLNINIAGTVHTVNGTLNLQHNLLKMTASANFDAVSWDVSEHCCYPTSGTIKTTFSGGPNSGLFESFTFTSATCTLGTLGEVTFTNINGVTSTKKLTHCF